MIDMIPRCFALFALIAGFAQVANASCKDAVMLGRVHDAYHATVNKTGSARRVAAQSLLVLSGAGPTSAFADQIRRTGIEVSEDRLGHVLSEARTLATNVILNPGTGIDRLAHGPNVEWLAALYRRTGCDGRPAHASPAAPVFLSPENKGNRGSWRSVMPTGRADAIRWILTALAAVAALIAAIIAVQFLRSTLFFRRQLAERQPRTSIALDVEVSYRDADGKAKRESVRAHDISAGGMKLGWCGAPQEGTTFTISLETGEIGATVIWSNAYFAGVMFDTLLEDEILKTLTNPDLETKNGAPKGAVPQA